MTQNNGRTQPASKEVPKDDRLKIAAIAMEDNEKLEKTDKTGQRGSKGTVSQEEADRIINHWPKLSQEVAQTMIGFYGLPNEITESQATWFYNGPWKRTTVHKDGYQHDFPEPHVDMLEQVINYQVPKEKVGDVGEIEGSLVVDWTKGEVTVHCDNEGANTLSLNMMHEVVTEKRTPKEAREFITEELPNYILGKSAPYAEAFQFELPEKEQGDPDVQTIFDEEMLEAVEEKQKELQ